MVDGVGATKEAASMAVAVKALDNQKQQGENVSQLLQSAQTSTQAGIQNPAVGQAVDVTA